MTLPRDLLAALRTEVGTFRAGERRRRFDARLCVGILGGERAHVVLPTKRLEYLDRQLRRDYVAALLEIAPADGESAWVARPGLTEVTDDDRAWGVAAQGAFASAGRALGGCYVVTRYGWADLNTGQMRVWKRLRLDR